MNAARERASLKRGGQAGRVEHSTPVNLDLLPAVSSDPGSQLCALDDALNALARLDPRRAQVIELRFFGGLTVEETGEVLKISPAERHAGLEACTRLADARTKRLNFRGPPLPSGRKSAQHA